MKIGGKEPKFLNDLDIASDGTIYLTDSSYTWDRRHNRLLIMENKPDGRYVLNKQNVKLCDMAFTVLFTHALTLICQRYVYFLLLLFFQTDKAQTKLFCFYVFNHFITMVTT